VKLLVDVCAGRRLAKELRVAGHDVDFAGDWPRNAEDDEILESANSQKRIVVTRDKDLGDLAVRDKLPRCGIVRLVELPPDLELKLCIEALTRHEEELRRGALVTVQAHRIRIREPESRDFDNAAGIS
jgi:predicted nuclease of predicted toxin-antitoxin system